MMRLFLTCWLLLAALCAALAVGSGEPLDITQQLAVAAGKSWREMIITGACTTDLGPTLTFASQGAFALSIGTIVREEFADGTDCSF